MEKMSPTTDQHGSFDLLRFRAGPVHPSLGNLVVPSSQEFTILMPKCPSTDEWIKKLWLIYTMEYYLVMRKNEIWPFAAMWMEQEGIMLSEISPLPCFPLLTIFKLLNEN